MIFFDGNGNKVDIDDEYAKKNIHPTRKILEQGGVVDGEAFEIMLREEAQDENEKALEVIADNLNKLTNIVNRILILFESKNQ